MNVNPKLICLVEDDALIIRLYERIFKLNQYDLRVADNGEAAILMLTVLTELPVVILPHSGQYLGTSSEGVW